MRKTIAVSRSIRCEDRLAALACEHERKAEQHRDEQDLQYVAVDKGGEERGRDDAEQELDDALALGGFDVALDRARIERGQVDIHADAGLPQIDGDKREHERDERDHLEIDQRLDRDAADALHVVHRGHTVNDGAEDHRRDDHAHEADEGIAQRRHLRAELGLGDAEQRARDHGRRAPGTRVGGSAASASGWLRASRARRRRRARSDTGTARTADRRGD